MLVGVGPRAQRYYVMLCYVLILLNDVNLCSPLSSINVGAALHGQLRCRSPTRLPQHYPAMQGLQCLRCSASEARRRVGKMGDDVCHLVPVPWFWSLRWEHTLELTCKCGLRCSRSGVGGSWHVPVRLTLSRPATLRPAWGTARLGGRRCERQGRHDNKWDIQGRRRSLHAAQRPQRTPPPTGRSPAAFWG